MKLFSALVCLTSAHNLKAWSNQQYLYELMFLQDSDCADPLTISEDSLHYQLGEFSRNFKMENWNNAMHIRDELVT